MFHNRWRCFIASAREARINHQIRVREVRVIGAQGEQLGVLPLHEALRLVEAQGLDLVEVAPDAQPPVCRMMDYGKYRYEQKKKSHGPKKHSAFEIKEVKMGSRTDPHDVVHKVRNIRQFIEKGQRVKVSVFFRGREITHPELGRQMLRGVVDQVLDIAKLDIEPRLEGRSMAMLLTPK
ncbi:MAG TPA: translation initiation factor IF-3 [Candidatus Acidoferrales bacterium]|jgi:translation initiation factor IF-3|nr:translation initiation factor IF-3 [Candidatus Acidoferrales bacterium]